MSNDQIDELYGKGSLGKIKQYHKDASAISTDSHQAKDYHDMSVRRTETLGKREKTKTDIAKAKKGSTREKGWRNYLQTKDDSAWQRKRTQDIRGSSSSDEKRIHNTYLKARGVQEDAPTNNVGSGAIAGAGVGAMGEPGVSIKTQRKKQKTTPTSAIIGYFRRKAPVLAEDLETFAGAMVFEVAPSVFHNAKMEKRKHKTWRKYLEEDDCLAEVREYANKHPQKPIILKNKLTGEMCYARYGKRG